MQRLWIKIYYAGNNYCPTQTRLEKDAEELRKLNQEKSSNNPPAGGYQKALVNVKDALCSLIMGSPTKELIELPSPGLMFCEISNQEVRQTEHINNSVMKGDSGIMRVDNTILSAAAEAGIDENGFLLYNQLTCNAFIDKKYLSNIRNAPNGQYLRVHGEHF